MLFVEVRACNHHRTAASATFTKGSRAKQAGTHWWRWRDLNPHGAKLRQILSLLRLPVPPHRHAPNSNTTRRANLRLTARDLAPLLARFAFRRIHSRSPCPHLLISPRV